MSCFEIGLWVVVALLAFPLLVGLVTALWFWVIDLIFSLFDI